MPESQNFEYIEGNQIKLVPAPLMQRFFAYAVDIGFINILYFFVVVAFLVIFAFLGLTFIIFESTARHVFQWLMGSVQSGDFITMLPALLLAFVLLLLLYILSAGPLHAYFIYNEYKFGSTPGKKIFGLSVVSLDGASISLKDAILRDFMRHAEAIFFLVPLISIHFTEKSQRLGDLMTHTMVTYAKSFEAQHNFIYLSATAYQNWSDRLSSQKDVPLAEAKTFLKQAFEVFLSGQGDVLAFTRHAPSIFAQYYQHKDSGVLKKDEEEAFMRYHSQRCFNLVNQDNV